MKRTKLKKHVDAEKYMSNTNRETHQRRQKDPHASIVLFLLLNMYLSVR